MKMKVLSRVLKLSVAVSFLLGVAALAQDVEPPFTWKGSGEVSFISEDGLNDVEFKFEMSVDENGNVKGATRNETGESSIKHLFYGDRVEHEMPGLYSRQAVIVIMLNEDGNNPMLAVLNGRVLAGRYFYGEVLVKRYEWGSDADKALGVGNTLATPLVNGELPWNAKSVIKKCTPVGAIKIQGGYQ